MTDIKVTYEEEGFGELTKKVNQIIPANRHTRSQIDTGSKQYRPYGDEYE